MRLTAILLILMLGGCWMGTDFYRGARPLRPIPAGEYLQHEPGDDTPIRMRVAHRRDGSTEITNLEEGEGGVTVAAYYPLPGARDTFVAKVTQMDGDRLPNNRIAYGILAPTSGGAFNIVAPVCDETRALAERHRARIVRDDPAFPLCVFNDRRRLEGALRALVPELGRSRRLVPAPPRR